jgi:hypothetical protein
VQMQIERITGIEATKCLSQAIIGAHFYQTKEWWLTYCDYCCDQWDLHYKNREHIRKTIGSLIWVCKEHGFKPPWTNEVMWEDDYLRVREQLEAAQTAKSISNLFD